MDEHRVMNDGGTLAPAADDLRTYAEQLSQLAEELGRIEQEASADEITYRIRDGEFVIIELAYEVAD